MWFIPYLFSNNHILITLLHVLSFATGCPCVIWWHGLTSCLHKWQLICNFSMLENDFMMIFLTFIYLFVYSYPRFLITPPPPPPPPPPHTHTHTHTHTQPTYTHFILTHWGRVTHICVGKLTIIGSDNGLCLGGAKPLSEPMLGYC